MSASGEKSAKPCICHVKKTGWPWKTTGRVEGARQELRCRICGVLKWV
jgi:hypothetical protein